MTGTVPTRLIDIAIRESGKQATMSFEELVCGCTPDEREQLAWHLAMMRARRTFDALRTPNCAAAATQSIDAMREALNLLRTIAPGSSCNERLYDAELLLAAALAKARGETP